MKDKVITTPLLLMTLFLAVAPNAVASTTRYVNGVTGSDSNNCLSPTSACKTIGHAISLSASGDSIRVAAAIYKENLTIAVSLAILGSGARTTIIDGGGAGRVVTISSATAHVNISGVTIRNGFSHISGAGIANGGTLKIINAAVIGNRFAAPHCLKPCPGVGGGGIVNWNHTLTIRNSTVAGNCAVVQGGGIYNLATAIISNSTLSGNSSGSGGAIANGFFTSGTAIISNSTLSGNSASFGGGIRNFSGTVALQNSIVANNTGGNCVGTMTSHGYNLSSDGTCDFDGTGDLNNTDPMLGPLQNNGGPTNTMALPSGSPAVDAGNPSGCTDGFGHLLTTDQRGKPRPNTEDTGGCDIGAYERQSD